MRWVRALGVGLIVALPWLGPAVSGSAGATACAAQRTAGPHAALVIDTGSRTTTYCVGLDAGTVSGLHLIQLAAAQYGLSYRLGFGGQAVCALDGVGSTGGDCFGAYPDYWGYWHGDGAGGWIWAGSGAASASIGQGDLDGWSWGSGDSGTSHAAPPAQRFEDVCAAATPSPTPTATPTPKPTHTPTASPTPHATPSPSVPPAGGSPRATPPARASGSPRGSASPRTQPSMGGGGATTSSSGAIVRAVATSGQIPSSGGPPAGALLALGAVALLGTGSWLTRRRRLREERR
jgi:hypothetical protein